jgi:methyl-accepting chemotaxis protein
MSTVKNRRRWRNMLTHPRFQIRLALVHTTFVVVILSALIVALLLPLYYEIQGSEALWVRYVTAEILLHLVERLGAVVLIVVIIAAIYHIVFSHRLCGPLVNFGHTLNALGRGDLSRKVYLRKKDYLQEEAASINTALSLLSDKIGALKANHAHLLSISEQLSDDHGKAELVKFLHEGQALLNEWTTERPERNDG